MIAVLPLLSYLGNVSSSNVPLDIYFGGSLSDPEEPVGWGEEANICEVSVTPVFTNGETEAQRNEISFPRSLAVKPL